ncbi:MAG: DUF2490 domain-containing protein [Spirosomataceae bacterium]
MKYLICLLISTLSCSVVFGQSGEEVIKEEQLWLGYFNQTRLSDKWGFWFDGHFRTTEHFVKEPSKLLIRPAIMYYINDHLKVSNGYTYVNHYPEIGHENISQPEHRIWQQIQNHTRYTKVRTMQWLRLEERFRHRIKNDNELGEGYQFDLRARFNYMLIVPLSRKGIAPNTFSVNVNNEIMHNVLRNKSSRGFDQNRFFAGLTYNFTAHSNLQVGYMNVYQRLASQDRYRRINSIRIFFFQNLDLRKKK